MFHVFGSEARTIPPTLLHPIKSHLAVNLWLKIARRMCMNDYQQKLCLYFQQVCLWSKFNAHRPLDLMRAPWAETLSFLIHCVSLSLLASLFNYRTSNWLICSLLSCFSSASAKPLLSSWSIEMNTSAWAFILLFAHDWLLNDSQSEISHIVYCTVGVKISTQ